MDYHVILLCYSNWLFYFIMFYYSLYLGLSFIILCYIYLDFIFIILSFILMRLTVHLDIELFINYFYLFFLIYLDRVSCCVELKY